MLIIEIDFESLLSQSSHVPPRSSNRNLSLGLDRESFTKICLLKFSSPIIIIKELVDPTVSRLWRLGFSKPPAFLGTSTGEKGKISFLFGSLINQFSSLVADQL